MMQTLPSGVQLHVQHLAPPTGAMCSGQIIVLIHGLIIDDLSSYYFTLANPLCAAGHEVVMYDLRGHGHSDRPSSGYTVEQSIADLDGLLTSLAVHQPVHVVGNSFGGAVAVGMAVHHPDRVASVTLIEGLFPDAGFGAEMAETLGFLTKCVYEEKWRNWIEERGRKTVKLARRGVSLIESTSIQQDLLGTPPYADECFCALQVPMLAIYGEASEIVWRAYKLAEMVPHMRLIVLPALDHRVLFNASPYVCQTLLWWLDGHAGEPPLWVAPDIPFEPAPLSRAMLPGGA